ncbi:DUF1624 domain-containing protein [Patescibacteria group bacterium]|nr:DUF1624 domain-containing protein [Patescibacteria group bacterium]MBU2259026.1 DUF1624 domain-containing protein [Patescibacteria group bacterium]
MKSRFIEIDLLRTLAIVMMVIYHTGYDLAFFHGFDFNPLTGGWKLLARSTATLFLLLVGISFVISWERNPRFTKILKRGLTILAFGMLITFVTYFWAPETYIRFGILHMIGVSMMLLPFFRKMREFNALIGLVILLSTATILNSKFLILNSELFLPFGITPPNFLSLDYYPLLPWFGVVLIGLALGDFFYIRSKRIPKPTNRILKLLSFPGKHALIIYLIHQPIIIISLSFIFTLYKFP